MGSVTIFRFLKKIIEARMSDCHTTHERSQLTGIANKPSLFVRYLGPLLRLRQVCWPFVDCGDGGGTEVVKIDRESRQDRVGSDKGAGRPTKTIETKRIE